MLPHDDVGAGPAILLLHAGIADRSMWREHLLPLAAGGHRVVALDLPGHGEAELSPDPQPSWAEVMQALDALAIDRAVLVGNSFGGAVALRVAAVAPARVSGLVLISAPAPGLDASPELLHVWEQEEAALEMGDIERAVRVIVDAWTAPYAQPALREHVAAMQRRAFELQHGAVPAPEHDDPLESDPAALARIEVPALVAAGDRDMVDFRDGAELLARKLPNARHAVIEGAGHLAPLETPAAFRTLVLDFLAEKGL